MPTERKLLRFAEAAEAYYHSGNDLFHRNLKGDIKRNRYSEGTEKLIQCLIPIIPVRGSLCSFLKSHILQISWSFLTATAWS